MNGMDDNMRGVGLMFRNLGLFEDCVEISQFSCNNIELGNEEEIPKMCDMCSAGLVHFCIDQYKLVFENLDESEFLWSNLAACLFDNNNMDQCVLVYRRYFKMLDKENLEPSIKHMVKYGEACDLTGEFQEARGVYSKLISDNFPLDMSSDTVKDDVLHLKQAALYLKQYCIENDVSSKLQEKFDVTFEYLAALF
ncbi:hypothetical protein PCE1_001982 [Barthelona sp. PCE]